MGNEGAIPEAETCGAGVWEGASAARAPLETNFLEHP